MFFEGDENKREANLRKHGLDPMTGAELFDGRSVFTYPTSRGDEERFVTIGLIADQFVAVVWTERRGAIRLISMRRARNGEKRTYREIFG